jgi:RNA polymerase sigma factor (sigma-70 family)
MLDRSRFNDGAYRLQIDEDLLQRIDQAIRAALEVRLQAGDEREDLVGETWERVIERWDELKDIEKAPAWSASIARRIMVDWARKRGRETKAIEESMEDQRSAAGFDHAPSACELLDSVTLAVSRLAGPQHDVVVFKYYGELSFAEIACQTGRTRDCVYQLYQRAKQKLQEDLM